MPADSYHPTQAYEVPTLLWVKDYEEYWSDDDDPSSREENPGAVGHLECRQCLAHVEPGHCADSHPQHIAGIAQCYINDEPVSYEEFKRQIEAQTGKKL